MFVIETFEAGCQPRHPPTAPLVANGIDTIKHCATAPKDRAPSPTSLYLAYASQRAMTGLGHGRPCRASRRCGGFTPESGPAGRRPSSPVWAKTRHQARPDLLARPVHVIAQNQSAARTRSESARTSSSVLIGLCRRGAPRSAAQSNCHSW